MSTLLTQFEQNTNFTKSLAKELGVDTSVGVAGLQTALKDYVQASITKTVVNSTMAKTDEPTSETFKDILYFFANGTPVTIVEREDGEEGALITWDGGEMVVPYDTYVFGGRHNDDTLTNTSIVMNGGSLRSIYGGGFHKSHTVIAKIVMNGGTMKNISGGGADGLTWECKCVPNEDDKNSTCITEEVEITLNAGVCTSLVYGGGLGHNCVEKATINMSGDYKAYYVTPGGANGYCGTATLNVSGSPMIEIVQGINRGYIETIAMNIEGGSITKLFVGGEIPFVGSPEAPNENDPYGVFKSAVVSIDKSRAVIGEMSYGGCDYKEITPEDDVYNNIVVTMK